MSANKSVLKKPSGAYNGATWGALVIGIASYLIGLWNATIQLNEKGYYLAIFLLALFSAVALQKSVRDREENMPVTNIFLSICWAAFFSAIALLVVGLYNAEMMLSEKGFYGISFVLSLFAVITAQKNVRDQAGSLAATRGESKVDKRDELQDVIDN